jgi:hypothetical protein
MSSGSRNPARYDSEVGKHRSSKNTRRWCKGVVGREHKPECVPHGEQSRGYDWRNWQCTACGKVLAHYWPLRLTGTDGSVTEPEPKPDWVTR